MVQPKYSPEEALQRAKLMMGYDTRKTLKENKETIEEQTWWKSMLGGASAGAISAGAVTGGVATIPGAVVGAILGLVMDLSSGTASQDKITKLIQACSKNDDEIGETTMSDNELDELSDGLNAAFNDRAYYILPYGTDEEKIKEVFSKIESVPDLCKLVNNYNDAYGDLLGDLNGDLDSDEEWRDYVGLPLRPAIRASKEASKKKTETTGDADRQKNINNMFCSVNSKGIIENPSSSSNGKSWDEYIIAFEVTQEELAAAKNACPQKGGVVKKTGGGGAGYKPCSGTYSYGCKSDVIAKVQGCLGGLAQDGKFGPKTKAKLSAKGFTTFTDSDVEKICSAAETKLTSDVESSDLSGEENVALTSGGQSVDPNTKDGIS